MKPLVAILSGSRSDLPKVEKAREVLRALDIPHDVRVLSAHRTPERTIQYVRAAEDAGVEVFIACAGMAAHLAGVVAGHTFRPVIGVPIAAGALRGMDALLATAQMPSGVPVATVGVDGTKNAAYLAARILAATRPALIESLRADLMRQREAYDSPDPRVPAASVSE